MEHPSGVQGQSPWPSCLLIAGPTASGKSALAAGLAARWGGVVINADSMQVYRELRVITARPDEVDVPHVLYGVRAAAEPGSAAWWRGAALAAMAAAREAGKLPILCGGTGLYFKALIEGLADIPEPSAAARAEARGLLAELGPAALHARLAAVDAATAARLRPGDSQRVARAWEVWRSSGKGLAYWQGAATEPAPWSFRAILLDPPRVELRAAIETRFADMLEAGAVDEVRALLALGLPPDVPAMRAHGVPELAALLRGEITEGEAASRAVAATRRYTKRQATWFRGHPLADPAHTHTIHARIAGLTQFSESELAELDHFIRGGG